MIKSFWRFLGFIQSVVRGHEVGFVASNYRLYLDANFEFSVGNLNEAQLFSWRDLEQVLSKLKELDLSPTAIETVLRWPRWIRWFKVPSTQVVGGPFSLEEVVKFNLLPKPLYGPRPSDRNLDFFREGELVWIIRPDGKVGQTRVFLVIENLEESAWVYFDDSWFKYEKLTITDPKLWPCEPRLP